MRAVRFAALGAVAVAVLIGLAPWGRTQGASGSDENRGLRERLMEVKKSAAENIESLHHYTWLQRTTLFYKGESRNVKDQQLKFGADGKLEKTLVSSTPEKKQKGPLRKEIAKKKIEELKEYMERVNALVEEYVPPVPAKMEAAYRAGHAMFGREGADLTKIQFKDYVTAGDVMTLNYDFHHKKLRTLTVSSFLDGKDPVSIDVVFKTLPDSTNYAGVSTVKAPAKDIEVKVENFDYRKVSK